MIIADSSGLISLLIETDRNHKQAINSSKKIQHRSDSLIIPEDVFSEVINILGKKFDHKKAFNVANIIIDSKVFSIEHTTEKIRLDALKKFEKQKQSVSFTDCLVMSFADIFNTKEIFGYDKTFSQNKYKLI
jgi:predicted nucleic acid-binding protein